MPSPVLDELSHKLLAFHEPNITGCQIADRDILSSSLQKSLRRAYLPGALNAAKGLIAADPRLFWRRLVTIAFEDFGLTNLALTAEIVEAARDRAWRARVGGDIRVAAYLAYRLTQTPGDRRIDDVYMLGVAALKSEEISAAVNNATDCLRSLVKNASSLSSLCERPVPMRSFTAVVPRACDEAISAVQNLDPKVAALCVSARKVSQCLLPVVLPSLLQQPSLSSYTLESRDLNARSIAGILPEAVDGYTAAGRAILLSTIRSSKELAGILAHANGVSPGKVAATLLFCIEGGQLRNELCNRLDPGAQANFAGMLERPAPPSHPGSSLPIARPASIYRRQTAGFFYVQNFSQNSFNQGDLNDVH